MNHQPYAAQCRLSPECTTDSGIARELTLIPMSIAVRLLLGLST
ncbi:hypothetical protein [Nostoc sp.]